MRIVAILFTLFWPLAALADDSPSVAEGFFATVFGLEYGAEVADAHRVKRYDGTVRFHVTDLSGTGLRADAEAFVAALPARIANLSAVMVRRAETANYRVFLVRRADFDAVVASELSADARAMNAQCLVGVTTRAGRIERSTAVIVADDPALYRRCLVEEVLQGLGPMNDDRRLLHSVFNDTSAHATFTPYDAALLNALYHPLVRPGMTRREAAAVLPQVLAELRL